ncbi:MAG: TRAP transporter substrate-binding protein [Burkholderiales bacterium]|nr:TRAP transporter substrate-binding protein [Burkholderiales bacterium]
MRILASIMNGVCAASLGLMGALAPAPAMAQSRWAWDMPNEYGPQTVPGSADAHFGALLKAATGGRLEVVNQYGGSISVKSRDMLDAVSTGAVPVAHFPLQAASGANPLFLVSNLPFLAQTIEESVILQKVIRPHIESLLSEYNAELLYFTFFPPVGVWSKTPLLTLGDYRGLRLRTNDAISTSLFKALGASPLQISWSDMLPQLQTGAISAVHTSISGGVLGQLWTTLPYYNDVGTFIPINGAIVSKAAMAKLPADVQEAVRKAGRDTEAWARDTMIASIKKEFAIAAGGKTKVVTINELSKDLSAAYANAAKPIISDWVTKTGARGKAIVDAYSKQTGKQF